MFKNVVKLGHDIAELTRSMESRDLPTFFNEERMIKTANELYDAMQDWETPIDQNDGRVHENFKRMPDEFKIRAARKWAVSPP